MGLKFLSGDAVALAAIRAQTVGKFIAQTPVSVEQLISIRLQGS